MYQSPTHSMLRHVCRAKQAVFFLPSKEMSVSKDPPHRLIYSSGLGRGDEDGEAVS
jgi:hypothetical protein